MGQMEDTPPSARHLNATNNLKCKTSIAVVGMACRLPGNVTSPAQLWELCAEGRGSGPIIPGNGPVGVPSSRSSDVDGHSRRKVENDCSKKENQFETDADFFSCFGGIAGAMEPHTRSLLEVVYEATENAGIPAESLAGTNTSVFTAFHGAEYAYDSNLQDSKVMQSRCLEINGADTPFNLISEFYDLRGPSESVDTSRSANLVPLHQGCETITSGDSEVSIVVAATVRSGPSSAVDISSVALNGMDGQPDECGERFQTSDQGPGVVALVLKSLDAALRDGDRVHCVIRATSLSQYSTVQNSPSTLIDSNVDLIRETYGLAGLDLRATGYVEAHAAGDPNAGLAASSALAETFGASHEADDPVLFGSVETAIGHAGTVTGLAAVIKLAYSMTNRQVVVSPDYIGPNSTKQLHGHHQKVSTALLPWTSNRPLRASIHSPGWGGGTSLHAVLESPPLKTKENGHIARQTTEIEESENESRVFVLSAADVETLRTMDHNLAKHLKKGLEAGESLTPSDLAYTLAERRSRLHCVAAVRANSIAELTECLDRPALKISPTSKNRRLGFVFNGQGAQWHAMGRELLTTYPVFASAMQEADAILRSYGAEWSLQEELMRDAKSSRVSEIHISQPVTVALQLSLVKLLRSWGVHPSAVVSHSTGEIAAAFTAGLLSFSQALGIVYHLGDLARKYYGISAQAGGMAAAASSAQDVQRYLADTSSGGRVVIACINSPQSVTISGDTDDLDEVLSRLEGNGIFARKLKVPMAYHSHMMLPLAAKYAERLRRILPPEPSWPGNVVYASPVTGALVESPDLLTPEHWVNNITGQVLFADAFDATSEQVDGLVEIGPHSTLSGPIREILGSREVAYMTCLKRPLDAVNTMQDLVCDLVSFGYPVSLREVNRDTAPKFVPGLPAYPWKHGSEALQPKAENSANHTEPKLLKGKSVWEPDILHSIPESIKDSMRITLTQDEADLEKTLVRASYYFISDAVLQLQKQNQEGWSSYSQDLFEWMVATVAAGKKSGFGPGSAMWSRASRGMKQKLYDELGQGEAASGLLVARVGAKLAEVVRGQVSPQNLLQDDLLNRYYSELPSLRSRSYKQLSRAAEIFAIKVPGAKVLEVGGGFGGATQAVLDGFGARAGNTGGTLLGHYSFANIKPEYIEAVHQDFGDCGGLIDFYQLDVEKNPVEQSASLAVGTFDLIVASKVLLETQSLVGALTNLRKLLKPGGKIFLVEITKEKLDQQIIFRVLPQWWSSDKSFSSRSSPVISIKAWDEALRDAGFTGVDFDIGDSEQEHFQSTSFIISTAATTPSSPSTVAVVYTTSVPEVWHRKLTDEILECTNISSVTAESWQTLEPEDKLYIFTGDMPDPFVESMDEASFNKLQHFLDRSRWVLWLSYGGAVDAQHPIYAETYGILRTYRAKDASKRFAYLDFQRNSEGPWSANNISHIVHVLRNTMDDKVELQDVDWEYSVKSSMLHIPRVFPISEDEEEVEVSQQPLQLFNDPNATFLIVGDVGGFAHDLALVMMEKGSQNLLVVDRVAETHAGAASLLDTADKAVCNVQIHNCDVSSEKSVVELLNQAKVSMPPIRGVVMAGALNREHKALGWNNFDQWKQAALSKVAGTLNLDRNLPPSLSFFIVLSSLAGVVGKPPTADFSVGSTFQAALARNLTTSGRPIIKIDIGGVDAIGGAGDAGSAKTIGSIPVSPGEILQLMEETIQRHTVTPEDAQIIVGLPVWSKATPESIVCRERRFGTMRLAVRWAASVTKTTKIDTLDPSSLLVKALESSGEDNAAEAVAFALRARLAAILRMGAEEIDPSQPLATYGVDSLIAVEMRSWLATASSIKLSVLEILNTVSLYEMVKLVMARNRLE